MAAIIREDRVPYPNPINIVHASDTALENGMIVGVKGFKTGERELYDAGTVAAGDMIAMVNCDALMYDESKDERDFTLVKSVAGKANYLQKGEIFTISKVIAGGTVTVGAKLKPKVGANVFEVSSDGVGAIAIVRKLVTFEGQDSAMIEIL